MNWKPIFYMVILFIAFTAGCNACFRWYTPKGTDLSPEQLDSLEQSSLPNNGRSTYKKVPLAIPESEVAKFPYQFQGFTAPYTTTLAAVNPKSQTVTREPAIVPQEVKYPVDLSDLVTDTSWVPDFRKGVPYDPRYLDTLFIIGHTVGMADKWQNREFLGYDLLHSQELVMAMIERMRADGQLSKQEIAKNDDMRAYYAKSPREASWHFTVDDTGVSQHGRVEGDHIDFLWHADSPQWNGKSVGVELCMYRGMKKPLAHEKFKTFILQLGAQLHRATGRPVRFRWHDMVRKGPKGCPHTDAVPAKKQVELFTDFNAYFAQFKV